MQNGSDNSSATVDMKQILRIVWKQLYLIVGLPMLFGMVAFLIAGEIPPKYKSLATVAIQANYFQNPLLGDLVVQVADSTELQSQRLALIKKALRPEFLEFLGDTYQQFKFPRETRLGATEREEFIKRIVFFPAGPGTFQISVIAGDPQVAKLMNEDVVAQIGNTLVTDRYQNLSNIQAAVRSQLVQLSKTLEVPVPNLGQELTQSQVIEREIANLSRRFTEAHPRIQELRRQLTEVGKRVGSSASAPEVLPVPSLARLPFNRRPLEEVYAELAKKLNYLNVVISMESEWTNVEYFNVIESPSFPLHKFFPQKRIFFAGGVGFGGVLSLVWIVFLAAKARRASVVSELSDALGLALLGHLPPLSAREQTIIRRAV
jgi:uncharacterized protein involved in exopolysaccharide biosynthesis